MCFTFPSLTVNIDTTSFDIHKFYIVITCDLCTLYGSQNKEQILTYAALTLQRGVTGTARMLHALTHSSISRQVREQM